MPLERWQAIRIWSVLVHSERLQVDMSNWLSVTFGCLKQTSNSWKNTMERPVNAICRSQGRSMSCVEVNNVSLRQPDLEHKEHKLPAPKALGNAAAIAQLRILR